MSGNYQTNSESYWDNRFLTDWRDSGGVQQSIFFVQIAIENLPSWLIAQMRSESLTVADWGCAQGDGTNVWSKYLNHQQLVGVDFSAVGIDFARKSYPFIRFVRENWLETDVEYSESYDIVFSSNVLEHFQNPYKVLEVLVDRAKKAVILLLPYRELSRCNEHFFSFFPDSIPLVLKKRFRLIWSRVINCKRLPNTFWPGEQILLVYAESSWIDSLNLSLNDCEIGKNDTTLEIASLAQAVTEREAQIASLAQAVTEREAQIASLAQAVTEREAQIASLTQAVTEREAQIAGLTQAVTEREAQIAGLTQAVTEREAQIAGLTQAVTEHEAQVAGFIQVVTDLNKRIESLEKCIAMIKQSTSWRITAPLRVTKGLVVSPKRTLYRILRFLFWKLPFGLRWKLQAPRLAFVRIAKGLPNPQTSSKDRTTDSGMTMTWSEFSRDVLSKRANYRGVFIQEYVIDWNVPLYQRPQHIPTALGRLGYLVIYRTINLSHDKVHGFKEISENVWITDCHEVDNIQDVVRSIYSTSSMHTPESILKNGRRGKIVYEYIDHIDPEISGDQETIKRLHNLKRFAFEGGADFIVASSRILYEEASEAVGRDRVILIPNGVDTFHYRNSGHKDVVLSSAFLEFRSKYKVIVGYFGAIAQWLWYDCIRELASLRPEIGFVFIGPVYDAISLESLEELKLSNILHLGPVDYKILPAYANQFDVCFIPFKPGMIAKTTSPLKLFEYFALEKPVVVTSDMVECTAYPEVFRGGSAKELSESIDKSLQVKDEPCFKARLRALADQNDWLQRAMAYETIFTGKFALSYVQSFIRDAHRADRDGKTYYENVYMTQEELYWRPILSWIDEMQDIRSVLDIGAAYGTLLTYVVLNKGCKHAYAIDPVDYMSTTLRRNLGINLIRADFERETIDLPIKFDLILFTECIEHLNFHPLPTLIKIRELLNPNGKLLLSTPDADNWGRVTDYYSSLDEIPEYDGRDTEWIDDHIWIYNKTELDNLLDKAGFIIEKFDYSPGVAARHLVYQLGVKP